MPGLYIVDQDDYVLPGYIGGESSPVKFRYGTTVVLFTCSPLRPGYQGGYVQPSASSAGEVRFGYTPYAKNTIIDLRWSGMSGANLATLLDFWKDTVRGMARSFYYTDAGGVVTLVHFATSARPDVRERAYDSYEVNVKLRVA